MFDRATLAQRPHACANRAIFKALKKAAPASWEAA